MMPTCGFCKEAKKYSQMFDESMCKDCRKLELEATIKMSKESMILENLVEKSHIKIDPLDLTAIRLQVAYSICAKHKSVYRKLFSDKGYVMDENEKIASEVLEGLIKLEPSFKPMLEVYFK